MGARNGGASRARRETTEVGENQCDKAELCYPWRLCYDEWRVVATLCVLGAFLKHEEGDRDGGRENRGVSNRVWNVFVFVKHREDGISEDRVLAVRGVVAGSEAKGVREGHCRCVQAGQIRIFELRGDVL